MSYTRRLGQVMSEKAFRKLTPDRMKAIRAAMPDVVPLKGSIPELGKLNRVWRKIIGRKNLTPAEILHITPFMRRTYRKALFQKAGTGELSKAKALIGASGLGGAAYLLAKKGETDQRRV